MGTLTRIRGSRTVVHETATENANGVRRISRKFPKTQRKKTVREPSQEKIRVKIQTCIGNMKHKDIMWNGRDFQIAHSFKHGRKAEGRKKVVL